MLSRKHLIVLGRHGRKIVLIHFVQTSQLIAQDGSCSTGSATDSKLLELLQHFDSEIVVIGIVALNIAVISPKSPTLESGSPLDEEDCRPDMARRPARCAAELELIAVPERLLRPARPTP